MEEKLCRRCGETKPLSEFHKDKQAKDGHYGYCKGCNKTKARAWYEKDPEHAKALMKQRRIDKPEDYHRRNLLSKYGLTMEQYAKLLEQQGGVCAICKGEETRAAPVNLAVDHDHETGEVRGLLCSNCNRALGLFKDSAENLEKAARYLESYL